MGLYISAVVACTSRPWWLVHLGSVAFRSTSPAGLYISAVVACTSRPCWLVHLGRGGLYISAVLRFAALYLECMDMQPFYEYQLEGKSGASSRGTSSQVHLTVWCGVENLYFEEIRVSQAGICLEYISMEYY